MLLLSGLVAIPDGARPGLPVQVHLAEPDPWEDEAFLAEWLEEAEGMGLTVETFRYPGVGHLFVDVSLHDFGADAADAMWDRVLAFLGRL